MTTAGRTKANRETTRKLKLQQQLDFSKVGGLSHHINVLKEIIMLPLMLSHVYTHFNIKPARGVLFYGPPGTGKTFVAGALAAELNKLGIGKVTFFQRKGADILDKWVGESERKLRELFEKADRARPSVIFFDELDGLAPERSTKNEQIHCSVVTTLLALMDGLDKMPGVVVIAATNRIDSVDPALRRPGRFDKELYFPLPSTQSRKEILQVHTQSWKHQLSAEALNNLAELTMGYSGSDLQALCAQAVLCSIKRVFPDVSNPREVGRIKIEPDRLKIEEGDFLKASLTMMPSSQKLSVTMRKLSHFIEPLLKNQLNSVLEHIKLMWPHFLQPDNKYLVGHERYAGRVLIIGSNMHGLNNHLVPAVLHSLEHLPTYAIDSPAEAMKVIKEASRNLPCILLLPKMDTWWEASESSSQFAVCSALEDLHAGNPMLLIATCGTKPPAVLSDYFYNSSSVVVRMVNPTLQEREKFLAPLFFSESTCSVCYVHKMRAFFTNMDNHKRTLETDNETKTNAEDSQQSKVVKTNVKERQHDNPEHPKVCKKEEPPQLKRRCAHHCLEPPNKIQKPLDGYPDGHTRCKCEQPKHHKIELHHPLRPVHKCANHHDCLALSKCSHRRSSSREYVPKRHVSTILTDIIASDGSNLGFGMQKIKTEPGESTSRHNFKIVPSYGESQDSDKRTIYKLWQKASRSTSEGFSVGHLELLYDMIATCINIYRHDFQELTLNLDKLLTNFEKPSCVYN